MAEKHALHFPLWAETLIVATFAIMAVVEYLHASWFWFAVFTLAFALFGLSAIDRALKGAKNGPRP